MPLNLDSTKSEVVVPEKKISFDSVSIKSHNVDNEDRVITIVYRKFMGEDFLSFGIHEIKGQDFLDIAFGIPKAGDSRYADNKKTLYSRLVQDLGLSGTVV